MAELADALDSGSSGRKLVWVQIPLSAPYFPARGRKMKLKVKMQNQKLQFKNLNQMQIIVLFLFVLNLNFVNCTFWF